MSSNKAKQARNGEVRTDYDWEAEGGIDSTARVHPDAELGDDVSVGPYAMVGPDTELGDGVRVDPHAVVGKHTTIGTGTHIFPHAVVGTEPQDEGYEGEVSYCEVGENCKIREFVTINRSSHEEGVTRVGDDCMLMATVHIAHDCEVGDDVTMANLATLAGHCKVERGAVLGGMAVAHQYVRIGEYAMIGGTSGLMQDVPPYMMAFGSAPAQIININHVGLKRNGIGRESRQLLRSAFRLLFREGYPVPEAVEQIRELDEDDRYLDHLCDFIDESSRGICSAVPEDEDEDEAPDPAKVKEKQNQLFDELTASIPAT